MTTDTHTTLPPNAVEDAGNEILESSHGVRFLSSPEAKIGNVPPPAPKEIERDFRNVTPKPDTRVFILRTMPAPQPRAANPPRRRRARPRHCLHALHLDRPDLAPCRRPESSACRDRQTRHNGSTFWIRGRYTPGKQPRKSPTRPQRRPLTDRVRRQQDYYSTVPARCRDHHAWAAANPDSNTGLTPSRPTAMRRMIRNAAPRRIPNDPDGDQQLASRSDLNGAVTRILERLDVSDPPAMPLANP